MKLIAKAEINQGKTITNPGEVFNIDDKTGAMLVERGLAVEPGSNSGKAIAPPDVTGDGDKPQGDAK